MSLKELLGEELYSQVKEKLNEHDDDVELFIAGENEGDYVPRGRLNEKSEKLENQIQQLENQLEQRDEAIQERDNQLEQLKEDTQATEDLQQKVEQFQSANEELEAKMEEQQQEFQQKLRQQKLEDKLQLEVEKADPRDDYARKSIVSNLDRDKIELDDETGEIKGLSEQLEDMQENATYLFGGEEKVVGKEPDEGSSGSSEPDFDKMSDTEYIRYREKQKREKNQ